MPTSCPKGVGPGGKKCQNCLKNVDLKNTPVFYSERPQDFAVPKEVLVTQCSKRH